MSMSKPTTAIQIAPRSIVVGLDLGTYGSGFSIKTTLPGASRGITATYESWPDAPMAYPKTRSALLYTSSRQAVAFGHTAVKVLSEMSKEEQESHRIVTGALFKLGLHDPSVAERLPFGLTPLQVVADYLSLMKPVIFDFLRKKLGHAAARPDNIQWCLTLPAMWSDAAKQAMREAALRAGLIRNIDSEALSIILEPEAAVLHALENKAPPLLLGETVMILDCGGGTVDTTVHCCKQGRGQGVLLAEAVCADGALCGAEYVDQHFLDHFREMVGADAFSQWMENHPAELAVVMSKWEAIKRRFSGPGASMLDKFADEELGHVSAASCRVPIMPGLHALMSDDDKTNLRCEQESDTDLELTMDCLDSIFSVPVQSTIDLAKKQLDALSTRCSKVLMVGGFASSPHLQSCVRAALDKQVGAIIIPPHNYAAVLNGAVLYGCNPELISARRSRMSYGIRACAPYEEGAPGKFWHDQEACFYTDSIFSHFVLRDQLVDRDEGIEHYFIPLCASQIRADIELFATTSKDAKYILSEEENMKSVGTMHIDLPPSNTEDRVITVTLKFGKTEIAAGAKDESSGLEANTRIRFAYRSA